MTKFENRDGHLYIDGKKVLHGWESFGGWYWFATELVEKRGYLGKPTWFGFVQGIEDEWGDFSQGELEDLNFAKAIWPIKEVDLPYAGRRRQSDE
jgi:hypothetical protein